MIYYVEKDPQTGFIWKLYKHKLVVKIEFMESTDTVVLEWTFSPPDFFEEQINLKRDDYELVIGSGKIEARIEAEAHEKNPAIRDYIDRNLNNRFLGVQLLTHKPYELSKPSMYRVYPDGHKDYFIHAESGVLLLSVGPADLTHIDKDGNVIRDTKAERIRKKKSLADLAEKYGRADTTVASLLKSYKMAVTDPNNELVHLYEIRDALDKKFKGKELTCKTLNISSRQWSRLGLLANDETLKQGRHRGQSLGKLRNATKSELEEARNIARGFVEAYLEYIELHDTGV